MYDVTHDELLAEVEGQADRYAKAWPDEKVEGRADQHGEARSSGEGEEQPDPARADRFDELYAAAEAEEREWLSADDIHPYKSRV